MREEDTADESLTYALSFGVCALAVAGRSTWVAISAVERRCDCKACSRFGLPLVCGKADSVHSLQGFTIGDTKKFKRLMLEYNAITKV